MEATGLCEARELQRKPVRSDVGRRQPQQRLALWQRACSEDLLQPGRGGAQEGQLGMQRRRRSCHRLCQLSHCRPHEEAKQSAAGPAIEGVALVWLPKGGGRKSTTSEMTPELERCMWPRGAAPRRSPRVSARVASRVPAFLTSLPTGSQWVRYDSCRYTYWDSISPW